jgi:hypothetical protein
LYASSHRVRLLPERLLPYNDTVQKAKAVYLAKTEAPDPLVKVDSFKIPVKDARAVKGGAFKGAGAVVAASEPVAPPIEPAAE